MGVLGYSFFVGVPGGNHNLKASPAMSAAPYTAFGADDKRMIQVNQGICTFTSIGNIGDNQSPRIYESGGYWRLTTTTIAGARARCYYYNQNQP